MINTLIMTAALACPATVIINKTDIPWNKQDQAILVRNIVMKRCNTYNKRFPCIVKAFKLGVRNYHYRCGKQVSNSK